MSEKSKNSTASGTANIASGTTSIASGTSNVASGTADAGKKPKKPAPGSSGQWGGGWGKPVTDKTPEELLDEQ